MPRHKQVTDCRKSGGPVSKHCSCEHCTLSVCSVCGASEGGLTTDCPGSKVDFDRQQEVYETNLDYTDERGWHLAGFAYAVEHGQPYVHLAQTNDGTPIARRSPRFEHTKIPPEPPRVDPRTVVAPSTDWIAVDRYAEFQYALAQKAIAWVLADREADDHLAALTRLKDEIGAHLQKDQAPNEHAQELLGKLEHAKIDFHLASQRAEKCDDEFRQVARRLVTALEGPTETADDHGEKKA